MARTSGQDLALEQLRAVARASGGTVIVGEIREPIDDGARVLVDVSLACGSITTQAGGIALRGRERLRVSIPPDFPFSTPQVETTHRRWAGTPHVHWGRYLCLYQAASEWDPQRGMYGFLERLWLWLERAAAGELDPEDAPLHPPMIYGQSGSALVVVKTNTPPVNERAWLGLASLKVHSKYRVDITGWQPRPQDDASALALLLAQPFTWEYPTNVRDLFAAIEQQGVDLDLVRELLVLASHTRSKGEPMHVVLGTPMRRGVDRKTRQHIAVWEIHPDLADALRASVPRTKDSHELAAVRADLRTAVLSWAEASTLDWCSVSEDRPEIVIRRDDRSPLPAAFSGKSIVIWGCGAIGGHVAEWIARAGAAKVTLYDNDVVTPGVLVRQPYTDADVGSGKAYALGERLKAIRPDLVVVPLYADILRGPLARPDWHDNADIVIDATASAAVRLKVEEARRALGTGGSTVVGMLFGHTAEKGVAIVVPPSYSGGVEDALRQAKLATLRDPELTGFADEFWPAEARTDHFQPEPGCSDVTFRGSGAEVAALSAALLHSASRRLVTDAGARGAHAYFHALPAATHSGRRSAEISFEPARLLQDGVGPYEIRLAPSALSEIRGWLARNDRALDPASETGGVLYGRRDEPTRTMWVDGATGPPPDSHASPSAFICGTAGVPEMTAERRTRGRGDLDYLGMWHTHPDMTARPSLTDLSGMLGLVASQPSREALMLIVGGRHGHEELAGYVFSSDELTKTGRIELVVEPHARDAPALTAPIRRDVGLALSGGGFRAVAFHLGCLRALHDRGVLDRVRVVSGVSGGALMTALWAYGPSRFSDFDAAVSELLRDGLQGRIARRALLSRRLPQSIGSSVVAGAAAAGSAAIRKTLHHSVDPPLPRWTSRTDAFEDVLRGVLGSGALTEPRRADGLDVVINACDLRTGNAFRFGSAESGSWQLGRIVDNDADLATAVAASAAYPLLLPALDRTWRFERRDSSVTSHRVILTDGGVFDNLGTSCLRPGRSPKISYNVFEVDYIIACDAGRGQLAPKIPFHIASRLNRSFEASFRKLQDAARSSLHDDLARGDLRGFVMPYLGQQDERLPWQPADLVRRAEVADYPTNFAAMTTSDLNRLATRGEQLARVLIERWCPEI